MNVSEFIAYLQTLPPETVVMIQRDDYNHELDTLDFPFSVEKIMKVRAEHLNKSGKWSIHYFYERVSDGRNRNEEGPTHKWKVFDTFDAVIIE